MPLRSKMNRQQNKNLVNGTRINNNETPKPEQAKTDAGLKVEETKGKGEHQ